MVEANTLIEERVRPDYNFLPVSKNIGPEAFQKFPEAGTLHTLAVTPKEMEAEPTAFERLGEIYKSLPVNPEISFKRTLWLADGTQFSIRQYPDATGPVMYHLDTRAAKATETTLQVQINKEGLVQISPPKVALKIGKNPVGVGALRGLSSPDNFGELDPLTRQLAASAVIDWMEASKQHDQLLPNPVQLVSFLP